MSAKQQFEAIINGNELESLDPVQRIIIDNGFHQYEFTPDSVQSIQIRPLPGRNGIAQASPDHVPNTPHERNG